MTRFVTVRAQDIGGPVIRAQVIEAAPAARPQYRPVEPRRVARDVAGKDVIFGIHGFNVSRPSGVRALAGLEAALKLTPDQAFFGVLWPGDFWLPVVNYPAEASDAVKGGGYLAEYLNAWMAGAASLSFVSHSLGGRLLLEAVKRLDRPAREVCIAAGAVDSDTLARQYLQAKVNAGRVSVLASAKDRVLKLAYPLGDFAADLFWGDDDSPWRGALGLHGPDPFEAPPKVRHRQIDPKLGYDHGDYFPPGGASPRKLWETAAAYMRRAVNGADDSWG